ncbi:hypothetical protein TPA2_gp32 [Tsukamurella phage TPA2]|uniref:hypothetical protein n=1 Tax=Tsukamurella phage TPA2 TaxID=981330 RepID=UPI0001FF8DB7|nr:hypothetical protein TPA2_gp32 [Tsukamurella phage TPA2]ADX31946.1 hypothetical protein [Tsukamurella phage TPA2]
MTAPSTPTTDAVFAEQPAAPAPAAPSAEVAVAEPAAEVAVPDGPKPWEHETMEFRGDTLEIRKPTQQALSGFSLASSKYVDMQVKNDVFGLFLVRHLSPESYGRVMSRLMDPDDADYDTETIGELVKGLVETAVPEAAAAAEQG